MKQFLVEKNNHDNVDTVAFDNKHAAIDFARAEWAHLTAREKTVQTIAVTEYDLPKPFAEYDAADPEFDELTNILNGGGIDVDWRDRLYDFSTFIKKTGGEIPDPIAAENAVDALRDWASYINDVSNAYARFVDVNECFDLDDDATVNELREMRDRFNIDETIIMDANDYSETRVWFDDDDELVVGNRNYYDDIEYSEYAETNEYGEYTRYDDDGDEY